MLIQNQIKDIIEKLIEIIADSGKDAVIFCCSQLYLSHLLKLYIVHLLKNICPVIKGCTEENLKGYFYHYFELQTN